MTEFLSAAPERHHTSESLLALPIETAEHGAMTVQEIAEPFYAKYGSDMSRQPIRFGIHFGTKNRGNKLLIRKHTEAAARAHLGPDVDAVGHQLQLPQFLAEVLNAEQRSSQPNEAVMNLSQEDIALVTLTCMLHDIGEHVHPDLRKAGITPVGDLPSGSKTDIDRANERAVRYFHYEHTLPGLPEEIVRRMDGLIAHSPEPGDELLHEIYELAHTLQTVRTVQNARFSYNNLFGNRIPIDQTTIGSEIEQVRPGVKNKLGFLAHGLATVAATVGKDQILELAGESRKQRGFASQNYLHFAAAREAITSLGGDNYLDQPEPQAA